MAVTVQAMLAAQSAAGASSDSVAFNVGANANRCLLVGIASSEFSNAWNPPTTITYGGVAVPVIANLQHGIGNSGVVLALLHADDGLPSGSNTLLLEPSTTDTWWWSAIAFNDVDPTTPNGTPVENESAGGNPSSTVSTDADSYVADIVIVISSLTIGANQTGEKTDLFEGGAWAAGMSHQDGADGGAMTWTTGGSNWTQIAVNINPVGGGPEPDPPTLVSISPNTQHRNATADVIVEDVVFTGTDFDAGNGTINSDNVNVTIESLAVDSATQITADVRIAPGSSSLTANLSAETDDGESDTLPFSVLSPTASGTERPTHRARHIN